MERQFFSGNTVEQAVLAAARHYSLDPERVAYTLRDKKHGFLNIRRRVVIEVDPEAPELSEEAAAERAAQERASQAAKERAPSVARRRDETRYGDRDRSRNGGRGHDRRGHDGSDHGRNRPSWRGEASAWRNEDHEDPELEALEEAVGELSDLVGAKVEVSVQRDEEGFGVELSGQESRALRDHRGSGLNAMEHLLPRMVRGLSGRGVPCRLDSEGYRAQHEDGLKDLAQQAAADACQESEEKRLEPMNPSDRRLVHMALADDARVRTESEGEGFLKRVRIVPI